MGFSLLRNDSADSPTGPFSISLWESKPFALGFDPFGVSHSAAGIFPFQSPGLMFRRWDFSHLETHTSLWVPLIWPTGRWTPGSFSLSGPYRGHSLLMGFPPLCELYSAARISFTRRSGSHSAARIFPTQSRSIQSVNGWEPLLQVLTEITAPLMGSFLLESDCELDYAAEIHSEAQLRYWDFSYSEVRIATLLLGFPQLVVDASNLSMGDTPLQAFSNLSVTRELMIVHDIWYIHEGSLVWIILSTYRVSKGWKNQRYRRRYSHSGII